MDLLALKNLVVSWLDDAAFGYFTEPQVTVWLNNAQKEVQKRLILAGENYYLKCIQTTQVVAQPDYDLPDDFLKTHRLEMVMSGTFPNEDRRPLRPITVNQSDMFPFAQSTPEGYFLKKFKIILVPAPDVGRLMRLYYDYRVADMVNDTDVPDVPEEFHEYIAVLAAHDGLVKDDRQPASLLAKKQYYEDLLKQMAEERTTDLPRMTVITQDDTFGNLF